MTSEAQNLKAIDRALTKHAEYCLNPPTEIRMNPFECERLSWDDYKGIPIVGDPNMQTGRVRIVCANVAGGQRVEAVAREPVAA